MFISLSDESECHHKLSGSNSLPLHSSKRIEPIFTVCLIMIHYLTIFLAYYYIMPWPLYTVK